MGLIIPLGIDIEIYKHILVGGLFLHKWCMLPMIGINIYEFKYLLY